MSIVQTNEHLVAHAPQCVGESVWMVGVAAYTFKAVSENTGSTLAPDVLRDFLRGWRHLRQ
jgi:hypothetical protein